MQVRDPAGQTEWLALLAADDLVVRRNTPTRRRLLVLARELARRANWETFEAWPTWERLMAATGWARSTMAAWLRELRLRGWITTIEHGSTPQYRPMARADVEGNRAAVYALRVPLPTDTTNPAPTSDEDKTRTPTNSFDLDQKSWVGGSSRARRVVHSWSTARAAEQTIEALRARFDESKTVDFGTRAPVGQAQMLAGAGQLRREHPILARMTPKAVRAECRAHWAAGWSNADVLHALRYRPSAWSTLPATADYDVIHPAGWMRSRLAAWRTPRGRVLPGITAERALLWQTRARHGRAAVDMMLRARARVLTPADVRERGRQEHAAAAETLVRNQRRDQLNAINQPPDLAASAGHRRAVVDAWRADEHQSGRLRKRLVAQARSNIRPADPAVHVPVLPPARSSEEALERARRRAAAERRHRGRR